MLSGLPIEWHTPTKLIVLTIQEDEGLYCSARSRCSPLCPPITGVYNDYGVIENIVVGPVTEYCLQSLREVKIDQEATLIQPAINDATSLDDWLDILYRGRPLVKAIPEPAKACFALIREDIWQASLYLSFGTPLKEFVTRVAEAPPNWIPGLIERQLQHVNAWIQAAQDFIDQSNTALDQDRIPSVHFEAPPEVQKIPPEALQGYAEVLRIENVLQHSGKLWHPATYVHPQDVNWGSAVEFLEQTTRIAREEAAKYADEE